MPRSVRLGARRSLLLLLAVALTLLGVQAERATAEPRQTAVTANSSPDKDATRAFALRDAADGESDTSGSASAAARAADKRVEDLSQRTETTQIFANPDGSWLADESAEPVRVKQDNGTWEDIDTTLEKVAGGFAPKAALGDLTISGGGDTELASLTVRGKDLDWSWPTTLPTPVIEGNTATYRDVVANGDLVVTATPAGFSHELVLRRPPAQPLTIRMPVSTDGAAITEKADGGLEVSTKSGDDLVAAPNPTMHDASTDGAGAPDNEVDLATTVARTGNNATITLQPDQSYLTDPTTKYPVTIDPYYVLQNPSGDTWVYNSSPTAIHPYDDTLHVGTPGGGAKYRSFFQFATGSWSNGAVISSSTLRLRNFAAKTCSGGTVNLTRVTQSWAPGSVNWNNQPDITTAERAGSNAAKGFSGSCPSDDVDWNATGIVQAWSNGAPNYGMRLAALDEGATNSYREFRSASYTTDGGSTGLRPRLLVYYNHAPNTPSALTLGGQSGANVQTLQPTISATTSDLDGAPTALQYSVFQGSSANPIYSGQGSQVNTSSGVSTAKVPAGVLSLGGTYTFKVFGWDGQYRSNNSLTSTVTVVSPPGPSAPTVTPNRSAESVPSVASAVPLVRATASDVNGGSLRMTFEIALSDGGSPIGSCVSENTPSGSPAACSIPSSAGLKDGGVYFARAKFDNGYDVSAWSTTTKFTVVLLAKPLPTSIIPSQDDSTLTSIVGNVPEFGSLSDAYSGEQQSSVTEIRQVGSSTTLATCQGVLVDPGKFSPCRFPDSIPQHQVLESRVKLTSNSAMSAWSEWKKFRWEPGTPANPVISCSSPFDKAWTATAPTAQVSCAVDTTSTGFLVASVRLSIDGQPERDYQPQTSNANGSRLTFTLPAGQGEHYVVASVFSASGEQSDAVDLNVAAAVPTVTSPAASRSLPSTPGQTLAIEGIVPSQGGTQASPTPIRVEWRLKDGGAAVWNPAKAQITSSVDTAQGSATVTASWDTSSISTDPGTGETIDRQSGATAIEVRLCVLDAAGQSCAKTSAPRVSELPSSQNDNTSAPDDGDGAITAPLDSDEPEFPSDDEATLSSHIANEEDSGAILYITGSADDPVDPGTDTSTQKFAQPRTSASSSSHQWNDCYFYSDRNDIVRTFDRWRPIGYPHVGTNATLRCGTEDYGLRHMENGGKMARFSYKGSKIDASGVAVANFAIAQSLHNPQLVYRYYSRDTYCYGARASLYDKDGEVIDRFWVLVALGQTGQRVITAYPSNRPCGSTRGHAIVRAIG